MTHDLELRTANQIAEAVARAFDDFVLEHFPSAEHAPTANQGLWKVEDGVRVYAKEFRCSCGESRLVTVKMKS